ncbi:RNA polymerase sigma-70 factor, ECF subfamily [Catalinimonas alkaloidigena]|uniref:RNA polymerase sigma factor n=1 Tax=Catalinimonas alkaloidigena TaxID=1075417 RepID=A0A1G9GRL2_9BACT|nr:sigma-70 family RNA polymerase sigma factor [Catalinimonas alkaloidigena]SDL03336.1 RNA polymerase sigma-70 factor, ECF subfamily [Catalinimonas alkaloidigena]
MDDLYLDKVLEGDTHAFRYFITQYKDMAFSIAMSVVKDEFEAEEVVQESFIKAFKGIRSFHRRSKFSTWLYRIVTNEAFKRLKQIQKWESISFVDDSKAEWVDESILLSPQEEEQTHLINEALRKLSPNESLVLRLFYLEEESVKEVSAITGWTEAKVKVTLFRARKSMLVACKELLNAT